MSTWEPAFLGVYVIWIGGETHMLLRGAFSVQLSFNLRAEPMNLAFQVQE